MSITEVLAVISISIGLLFYIFGVIGLIRFPDVYSRIHAAGKVSGLGIVFFVIGAAILLPEASLKALALGVFMILTQPVGSYAIANAAYTNGNEIVDVVRDDLKRDLQQGQTDATTPL